MEAVALADTDILVREVDYPANLRYHISLLTILANCNLGPKLQAIYSFEEVLLAMLDPATLFPVRRSLGRLLIEMLMGGIDGAEYAEALWLFIDDLCLWLEKLPSQLKLLSDGKDTLLQRMEIGEWMEICLWVITVFFEEFDITAFFAGTFENDGLNGFFKLTRRTEADIEIVIHRLFTALNHLRDTYNSLLGTYITDEITVSMLILSHLIDIATDEHTFDKGPSAKMLHRSHGRFQRSSLRRSRTARQGGDVSKEMESASQQIYRKRYAEFIEAITVEPAADAYSEAVEMFEGIPLLTDNVIMVSHTQIPPMDFAADRKYDVIFKTNFCVQILCLFLSSRINAINISIGIFPALISFLHLLRTSAWNL